MKCTPQQKVETEKQASEHSMAATTTLLLAIALTLAQCCLLEDLVWELQMGVANSNYA